ncbi:MAG: N-acetylmuramoyl-L-alanine amidase [Nocardioides sp.]|nr:N-acetylmuramoyl-L-alanine amidase [Nocardioides sp.]
MTNLLSPRLSLRLPLTLATAAVVALTGTLAATPAQAGSPAPAQGAAGVAQAPAKDVKLVRDSGSVVRAANVPVLDAPSARTTAAGSSVSAPMNTSRFKMVAATWRGAAEPKVSVRVRRAGEWSRWTPLETLSDGPNGKDPRGTDLKWVGPANGVRIRNTGPATRGLELVLINPGRKASDRTVRPHRGAVMSPGSSKSGKRSARRSRTPWAPMPVLFSRRKWGANNAWRNGKPRYNRQMRQVHVHHTVNGNNYSRADVPGILRGIYRYHTKSLGWFDVGYNFLVDKFGRIWVGRSGGPRVLVRGAHTLGFNQNSVGIAVIGNYDLVRPPPKVIRSIVRISAWKLDKAGKKRARGRVWMRSQGSDRFRNGRLVRLPSIDGHRDTNQTACPGSKLYAKLPAIRRRAQARINQFPLVARKKS